MYMAKKISKSKFSDEIDREIRNNPKYIRADKELHKIINKELSPKKVQDFDELLGILLVVVGKAYEYEGIKLGTVLITDLLHG